MFERYVILYSYKTPTRRILSSFPFERYVILIVKIFLTKSFKKEIGNEYCVNFI